ncbi:hypothetical protein JAAARDRAFT_120821 [Jaapia argillacea MUCL 33604]|uniref:Ima1 N-terminal domain-containing protein n=1 Tax=Jaapia argillacea MUCL 33604 TaxID=933084 RepID=A0A067QBF0_9AGAM|nr:hypothetical protein JAAARDRAFT_120821 [Jaapia argillacea MUCL 33604]
MASLIRRPTSVSCFFCNTPIVPLPQNPRSFRCPHCQCWNRFDANGDIMSDEPAMHDEALNARSFAKRASPSKDRFTTAYSKGPFCHDCTTNQMLLTNLLANYLPPTTSPDYARRLEMLPEYKESLYRRYPPVCASCAPAVEDAIKSKDHMARTSALGGWLKESKGKGKQRQTSVVPDEGEKVKRELTFWRVRGGLWVFSLATVMICDTSVALGYRIPFPITLFQPILPIISVASVLWTAWDPTYHTFRTAKHQGRAVRVQGKRYYDILQILAWLLRTISSILIAIPFYSPSQDPLQLHRTLDLSHETSLSTRSRIYFSISLFIELSIFITSCFVLRLHQPPPIRLIETDSHKRASLTPAPEFPPSPNGVLSHAQADPDLLATLSLSSNPILTASSQQKSNPIFGLPSLLSQNVPTTPPPRQKDYEDEMDWTPTNPSPSHRARRQNHGREEEDDGAWLKPQRFFPPEKPTGLENLFPRIKLVDETEQGQGSQQSSGGSNYLSKWKLW